jgi:hypothetical protein
VSDTWGSARQALAYMFSCRRGPQLRQPRYTNAPGSTGHHHLDHVLIGALVYGPMSEGGCGVEPGDELEWELLEWAMSRPNERDDAPSAQVLDVLTHLRELLDEHGLRARPTCPEPSDFVRYVYPDGTRGLRMRDHRAKSTG